MEARKFKYDERPKPAIKEKDDVLLRVLGVGICGTDLHILMDPQLHPAKPGIILGHEFCGQVEEVGEGVTELKKGDKVIVDPHPPCGQCDHCRSDRPLICSELYGAVGREFPEYKGHANTRGIFQDGALGHICVPASSVFKLGRDPFECSTCGTIVVRFVCATKLKVQPGFGLYTWGP